MTSMSTNADLLEIEAVHAQHQADLLHGIAVDLQEAVSILTSRARDFEACSQHLRTLLQTSTATTTASHLSAKPNQEDALRTANAMASTDAMVEILEQVKRDMEALTRIMCKSGATEQSDAKVYVDWKNSSRALSINFEDLILEKAAAISALTGIKFSFPVSISPLKLDRFHIASNAAVSEPRNSPTLFPKTNLVDRSIKTPVKEQRPMATAKKPSGSPRKAKILHRRATTASGVLDGGIMKK